MSPSDLHGFEPAGLTTLERVLRAATEARPPCNTKCGATSAPESGGFCASCVEELPPVLRADLGTVRGVLVATSWLVELRREQR